MRLVRDKLIPLRLLIPAGPGTHEWSREYRDLIFEMALFVEGNGGEVTLNLVRKFGESEAEERHSGTLLRTGGRPPHEEIGRVRFAYL